MNGQRASVKTARDAAGFLNKQQAGRHIPQMDPLLKSQVDPAAGSVAQQQERTVEHTQAAQQGGQLVEALDGLIIRTEYPQIPPKVEYRLSERGKSLMPILDQMCEWGDQNR